jgi:predicted 3-demethylubiquinone-9 3-methyltransferase (glyoxalase superfamily)
MSTNKITPFLWFDGKAEDAMKFYTSVFKNSSILNVSRAGAEGPVFSVTFEIEGQRFMGLNAGPQFKFTEAISFFVNCENQEEVDYYWNLLSEGGQEQPCGWLKDKFGLSWQIIPKDLGQLLGDKDPVKSNKVMQAMLKMSKIDVAGLRSAYEGA